MSEGADFQAARLTVRLGAIAANYRTYRRLAGPKAVAAVVKADAYGLGAGRVVPALVEAGCDSFFVARLEEAIALRALQPRARIRDITYRAWQRRRTIVEDDRSALQNPLARRDALVLIAHGFTQAATPDRNGLPLQRYPLFAAQPRLQ